MVWNLTEFGTFILKQNSSPFIQQLNLEGKLDFVQWFIQNNQTLFVWDLLKNQIFNHSNLDQQIRSTDDLFLRQQAKKYTVPWNEDNKQEVENLLCAHPRGWENSDKML